MITYRLGTDSKASVSVNGQDERRINAPPLTVLPVFANSQSRRESPKMASRPFQFLEKKRSKIRKRASKHFEGLAALSTHSAGQRAEVKAGCKPVHFSLETLHKTGLFSDIRLYNREGVKLLFKFRNAFH